MEEAVDLSSDRLLVMMRGHVVISRCFCKSVALMMACLGRNM
jgi:hypothetical protein